MLPGIGDYRDPYEDYKGYLWDDMTTVEIEEEEGEEECQNTLKQNTM